MDREQWNSRYAGSELLWSAHPNRFLAAEVAELAPGRALDLACGEGRNAVWLGERGWEVTGVDFSDVALAKAAKLADERGVRIEWIQADLLQFVPEPGSFDLIVVLYLHLVAADRRKVLAGVAAAVAGGGVLLVVGHDASNLLDGYGGPKDPAILFTPDEVAGELSGLRIERAERVRRPVDSPQGETYAIDALVRAERSDLERRRRSGADRFDEVWEGVYHVVPGPSGAHARIDAQLLALLHGPATDAGLYLMSESNLGESAHDFRVPDGGLQRSGADSMWYATAAMVIEIVSPGDESWNKLPFYAKHDVDEVLIVEPAERTVAWLVLRKGEYRPVERSALIALACGALAEQIDWP